MTAQYRDLHFEKPWLERDQLSKDNVAIPALKVDDFAVKLEERFQNMSMFNCFLPVKKPEDCIKTIQIFATTRALKDPKDFLGCCPLIMQGTDRSAGSILWVRSMLAYTSSTQF